MKPPRVTRVLCRCRLGALLLLLGAAVSCSDESTFSLDLRAREVPSDPFECVSIEPDEATGAPRYECSPLFRPHVWVSSDGEVIEGSRLAWTARVDEFSQDVTPICGGRPYARQWYTYLEWVDAEGDAEWALRTGSGDIIVSRGTTLVVQNSGQDLLCSEEVGRWQGTSGRVAGRSGTYREVYDSIQTVLRLTEGDCPPPTPTHPGDDVTSAARAPARCRAERGLSSGTSNADDRVRRRSSSRPHAAVPAGRSPPASDAAS